MHGGPSTCVGDAPERTLWCSAPGTPGGATAEALAAQEAPDGGVALRAEQFLGDAPHSGTTFEVVGSGGTALALLGVCLVAADRLRRPAWLLRPLLALGSMPLTAYAAHIAGLAVTYHLSFDSGGWLAGGWQLWAVLVVVIAAGCTLWARFLGQGPLERLVSGVVRGAVSS